MGRIFGTDGARGIANTEISCKLAMNISRAASMVLAEKIGRRPKFLIGKDTRISSDMLEAAVISGLCSVGSDAVQLGVVPTPAVAYLAKTGEFDAGIMLSASHNSYEFNGIKVFGGDGMKLCDDMEFDIEAIVLDKVKPYDIRWGWELGRVYHESNILGKYIGHIAASIDNDLSGLKVALDCANGSASATAERLFGSFGAECFFISHKPDGLNINRKCGSTHIEGLSEFVVRNKCDVGMAFDGDADRCLAVDENGEIVDGDRLMAIAALSMKEAGTLKKDCLVVTVMSNMGLFKFAEKNGLKTVKTKVGDRYVLAEMVKHGYNIGGEQSGHIIFGDVMPTGDGQLTAVQILSVLKKRGCKMSELAEIMTVYPQVMINVRADSVMKSRVDTDPAVANALKRALEELGDEGRVLVRPSGTEPLIRVMAEGADMAQITDIANRVAETIQEHTSDNEQVKNTGKSF